MRYLNPQLDCLLLMILWTRYSLSPALLIKGWGLKNLQARKSKWLSTCVVWNTRCVLEFSGNSSVTMDPISLMSRILKGLSNQGMNLATLCWHALSVKHGQDLLFDIKEKVSVLNLLDWIDWEILACIRQYLASSVNVWSFCITLEAEIDA